MIEDYENNEMLKYKLKIESENTQNNSQMPQQQRFKIEAEYPPSNSHQQIKMESASLAGITAEPAEKIDKIMKLKKECRRFKDLLEPLIDLSQPNVTTIMQRPVDMGETKRYKRKNYEDLEKRRVYQCKYLGNFWFSCQLFTPFI